MKIQERIHEFKTGGIRQNRYGDSDVDGVKKGSLLQWLGATLMGIFVFAGIRLLVGGLDTSGWSDAEITIVKTLIPLALAIMAIVAVLSGWREIKRDGRREK